MTLKGGVIPFPHLYRLVDNTSPTKIHAPKTKPLPGESRKGPERCGGDVQAEETLFLGGMRGVDFLPCTHYLFFTGLAVFSKCLCGSQFAGPHEVG